MHVTPEVLRRVSASSFAKATEDFARITRRSFSVGGSQNINVGDPQCQLALPAVFSGPRTIMFA